jgi:hypothetical protein
MADYGQFKFGNTVYPLTSSLSNSLLKDANPPLYYALDYLTQMLTTHIGARFDAACVAAGLPSLAGIVKTALPYDPIEDLLTQQIQFPLLAVWEKESITEKKSFSWYHSKKTWNLLFVLPPLTSSQKELLYPILYAADAVIRRSIEQGYDPAYNSSEEVWSASFGGLEKIQLSKSQFGNLPSIKNDQMFFPTLLLTIEASVKEEFNTNMLSTLSGMDITQQLGGQTFIQSSIDVNNATWTPASISTQLWLAADVGVTTNGLHVSAWADQSGHANNATQSGAITSQPTYISSWMNGKPAIYFDANDYLKINSNLIGTTSLQDFTIAVVHQFDEISVARTSFILGSRVSAQVNADGLGTRSYTKHGVGFCTDGAATTSAEHWIQTGSLTHAGDISKLYVNGIDTAILSNTAQILTPSTPDCFVGSLDNALTRPMFGSVAEIVVSNFKWNTATVANWTTYIHTKYGI